MRRSSGRGGKQFVFAFTCSVALLFGCAAIPPVQEMSDARQAIDAAKEAHADRYAPQSLRDAEQHLEEATRELNHGAYDRARNAALAAKAEAVLARDRALTTQRD